MDGARLEDVSLIEIDEQELFFDDFKVSIGKTEPVRFGVFALVFSVC